ncbi:hypothetical protein ACFSTI_27380 [Rhizorhabdus histidinilytica]
MLALPLQLDPAVAFALNSVNFADSRSFCSSAAMRSVRSRSKSGFQRRLPERVNRPNSQPRTKTSATMTH